MIKKFENFDSGENLDPELEAEIRFIYEMLLKAFDGENIYNFSYRYGKGYKLLKLCRKTDDTIIRSILGSIADYCEEQFEGGADFGDYVEESDLDYLAEFLGEQPIDWSNMSGFQEEWFQDEGDDDYDYDDDQDTDEEEGDNFL